MTLPSNFPFVRNFCVSLALSLVHFTIITASAAQPAAAPKRSFDLPAGLAEQTLKRFSEQSGMEVLVPTAVVKNIRTLSVRGEMTSREALDKMLRGTALVALPDEKNRIVTVRREDPVPAAKKSGRDPAHETADDSSGDSKKKNETRTPSTPEPMKRNRFLTQLTAILAMMVAAPADAQTAPASASPTSEAAKDSEAIEMSPFVITETSDTGWVATETLAGTRLRTNFKDVPNQIETLTKDFMSDLGLTSLDQALIYTANVENSNDYLGSNEDTPVGKPASSGRIRGLGTGTLSRNFFQIHNPTDNFNLERVSVASGPNAILFGLGSPAGIFDATPARAIMRNTYGFELQYDSEHSKRGTFDANVMVVPKKLALRVMGLSKREHTDRKPNLDRDERLYGAITFTPFENTTIILQGEKSNRNWNRAGRSVAGDFVTLWYNANQIAGSSYTTPKPVFDNSINASFNALGSNPIFVRASEAPVLIQGGSVPLQSWRNSVSVKNPTTLPDDDSPVPFTLLDESIFPFDVNLFGTGRTTLMGAYTKTAIVEQKLARNLFLELAYNAENSYSHRVTGGSGDGGGFDLGVDANQFIPGTTTPNPNLGKLYFQGSATGEPSIRRTSDWRATLSYELDLGQKFSGRGTWGKWLGRHRFAGLHTESKLDLKAQQGVGSRRILDDPVIPGVTLRPKTFQNWANHPSRKPEVRHYFDSPYEETTAAGPMTGDWTLTDANGNPFTAYLYATPLEAADGKRLAGHLPTSASLNQTAAQIFAWQGFFLPDREKQDRLVLTFGYRKDRAKSATLDAASTTQDFSGLYPVMWDTRYGAYGNTQTGINRSFGVVARPLKWLSAFYNQSTTFDLNIGRFDPFGNEIAGASGKGRDYGVRFDLWNDKITLRLNKYENSLGPTRSQNDLQNVRTQTFNVENRVRTLDPSVPTINVVDGNQLGFRVAGTPNYFVVSDLESSGYEVELNMTLVRNWNVRINGSRSETTESNIGLPWRAWVAERLPVWQSVVAKNGEVDGSGQPVTWETAPFSASNPTGETLEQYYNRVLVGGGFALMEAADGRASDKARGARANVITNYRFSEGRLKGFNIGGAARWRAAPAIGYGATTSSTGQTVLDPDTLYKGKTEFYMDAFLGYRGRMNAFGGFNYRLQCNVRNILDEADPIPIAAATSGQIVRIGTVEPRVVVLTFAVDF